MSCKSFCGRWGLLIFGILFSLGVFVSVSSPSWILVIKEPAGLSEGATSVTTIEYAFGPFYSQNRTCDPRNGCGEWFVEEVSSTDCDWVVDADNFTMEDNSIDGKMCRHNTTWRVMAIMCGLIVLVTGVLVLIATFTQCLTCGCCGGSFDQIAVLLYWLEVIFSIVGWSFTISTVFLLKEYPDTQDATLEWAFWLFIFSGTICGAICATLADWAAEGSLLKCLFDALKCIICCGRKD